LGLALLDVGVGLAAHACDALVEVVKRAALELAGELAAAPAVLGLADGRHLRCEVHQQLHQRRLRQVDDGGELACASPWACMELARPALLMRRSLLSSAARSACASNSRRSPASSMPTSASSSACGIAGGAWSGKEASNASCWPAGADAV